MKIPLLSLLSWLVSDSDPEPRDSWDCVWEGWGRPNSAANGVEVGGASMAGRGCLGIAGGGPDDTCTFHFQICFIDIH